MMPQLIRLEGGNGGISMFCCTFFELCSSTGPTEISAIVVFSFFKSRRGVFVLKTTVLRKMTRRRSTLTLLALLISAEIGIDWPGTYPI